jgi:Family of unknown function (DUF6338)
MVVDTGTAILILGVFVLPGFITLIFRERLYVVRGQETPFERLLSALFYSALIYGGLLLVAHHCGLQKSDIVEFHDGKKPLGDDLLVAAGVFLVFPAAIAVVGSLWTSSTRVRPWLLKLVGSSEAHSITSGWNELFSKQGASLIRATLSDGRVVGGFYDEPSLAGYSEQTQDLYINERWELDEEGWFVKPAERSLGIWLPRESIVSLEIYDAQESSAEGKSSKSGGSWWRKLW